MGEDGAAKRGEGKGEEEGEGEGVSEEREVVRRRDEKTTRMKEGEEVEGLKREGLRAKED